MLVCSLVEITWENSSTGTEQCLVIELQKNDKDKNSFGERDVKYYPKKICYIGFERFFVCACVFSSRENRM